LGEDDWFCDSAVVGIHEENRAVLSTDAGSLSPGIEIEAD
jgi:hypothetical protein